MARTATHLPGVGATLRLTNSKLVAAVLPGLGAWSTMADSVLSRCAVLLAFTSTSMVALCTLLAGVVIDSLIVEARLTWMTYSVPGVITAAHHTMAWLALTTALVTTGVGIFNTVEPHCNSK